jgi:drug/metabolite transporter (DMT)-like permease
LAGVILLALCLWKRTRMPGAGALLYGALSGVTMLVLPTVLTVWASGRISPGLLVVILSTAPLIAALWEGRARGGLLTVIVAGVGGTCLLASQALSFDVIQWAGALAVLAASISVAGSLVFLRRELSYLQVGPLAAVQFCVAAVLLGFCSRWLEGPFSVRLSLTEWGMQLVLAVLGGVVAFPAYYWLLRRQESFVAAASQWMVTLMGVLEGVLVVQERPSWRLVAGSLVVAASLAGLWRSGDEGEAPATLLAIGTANEG